MRIKLIWWTKDDRVNLVGKGGSGESGVNRKWRQCARSQLFS